MAAPTKSSGVASRPREIRLRILRKTSPFKVSCLLGVRKAAGARALIRIPSEAHSKAGASVRWDTPALISPYTDRPLIMLRMHISIGIQ
jgi:hypothetical protein